jgi:asparagine synthase (glutamine-hydrolysing)
MADAIAHRGPDDYGEFIDERVALGFRRLSIIDLNDGAQPIWNEDGTICVVFNGEIYNYAALREELAAAGHAFATRSDTETLVHLYEEHGADMLPRIRGMFAFVVYDTRDGSIFAARDFFGIKPFYYCRAESGLIFASEIKAMLTHPGFHKELNEDALENYLTFQYSVLDETFFKGVYKLPPGHYMTYKDGDLTVTRYYEARFAPEPRTLSETIERIENVLLDSVEAHKVSDVEVGSFLSSGVDSSFVAATFGGAKTFTVGFDYDKYNEIDYAARLSGAVGVENYSKMITTDEYWDALPKVQYHMDEPLADPSAVALYFVSRLASAHVKVALSGEGADEFFGGYNIYREPLDLRIMTDTPRFFRRFMAWLVSLAPFGFKGKSFFIRASKTIEERFIGNAYIFPPEERSKLLRRPKGTPPTDITKRVYDRIPGADDVTKMQYADINLWMVGDILLKADKMSMAHSLEVRVPYLDKDVFSVASRVQTDYRVNRQATKYAFRMAAKSRLPQETAEKKKLGFPVPIRIWLRENKRYGAVREAFLSKPAARYFDTDRLLRLLDDHKNGKRDNSRKIWTVYMFLVWHGIYFGEEEAANG